MVQELQISLGFSVEYEAAWLRYSQKFFLKVELGRGLEGPNPSWVGGKAAVQSRVSRLPNRHLCVLSRVRLFCDPMDSSPPVCGISQARTLEWVAISFANKCF